MQRRAPGHPPVSPLRRWPGALAVVTPTLGTLLVGSAAVALTAGDDDPGDPPST